MPYLGIFGGTDEIILINAVPLNISLVLIPGDSFSCNAGTNSPHRLVRQPDLVANLPLPSADFQLIHYA